MRASLNMLIVMVIGITMLGCMFKSYRMLNSLEKASKYAKQQQQENTRFQQFSQAVKARENIRIAPRQRQTSSLKMIPYPFGPRTKLRMSAHPFGPPLNLRGGPTLNSGNYSARQSQAANSSLSRSDNQSNQPLNSSQSTPVGSSGSQNVPPDSAAGSVIKGWSGYVATLESLEKD